MTDITLWGFNGSTYVRTVRMLLDIKGAPYDQVPLNVLAGDPRTPEHLERHPFGKVPVVDCTEPGQPPLRLLETSAITRYLNDVLPGQSLVPATPRDRARADMVVGLVDSYGYTALVNVAGYHLFPDFVGGQNDATRQSGIETGRKVLDFAMRTRGADPFIAGSLSLAELYLAPILSYVAMTPDAGAVFDVPGLAGWWDRVQALPSYAATAA